MPAAKPVHELAASVCLSAALPATEVCLCVSHVRAEALHTPGPADSGRATQLQPRCAGSIGSGGQLGSERWAAAPGAWLRPPPAPSSLPSALFESGPSTVWHRSQGLEPGEREARTPLVPTGRRKEPRFSPALAVGQGSLRRPVGPQILRQLTKSSPSAGPTRDDPPGTPSGCLTAAPGEPVSSLCTRTAHGSVPRSRDARGWASREAPRGLVGPSSEPAPRPRGAHGQQGDAQRNGSRSQCPVAGE